MINHANDTIHIGEPGKWDVLCGRGRGNYEHLGNRRFLAIVDQFKSEYQNAPKLEKAKVAQKVAREVLALGGVKFIRKSSTFTGEFSCWETLNDQDIQKKVSHTLREQKMVVQLQPIEQLQSTCEVEKAQPASREPAVVRDTEMGYCHKPHSAEGLILESPYKKTSSFAKLRNELPVADEKKDEFFGIADPLPFDERARFLASCSSMFRESEIELLMNSDVLKGSRRTTKRSIRGNSHSSCDSLSAHDVNNSQLRSGSMTLMSWSWTASMGSMDLLEMFDLSDTLEDTRVRQVCSTDDTECIYNGESFMGVEQLFSEL